MNDVVFLSGHCDLENESGPSVAHSAVLNTVLSGLVTQVVNVSLYDEKGDARVSSSEGAQLFW